MRIQGESRRTWSLIPEEIISLHFDLSGASTPGAFFSCTSSFHICGLTDFPRSTSEHSLGFLAALKPCGRLDELRRVKCRNLRKFCMEVNQNIGEVQRAVLCPNCQIGDTYAKPGFHMVSLFPIWQLGLSEKERTHLPNLCILSWSDAADVQNSDTVVPHQERRKVMKSRD